MPLNLQQLLPSYFDPSKKDTSEVWGKDIAINPGEYIKIVAPSGSGKTSLIHFLYGIRDEYTGTISYDGKPLSSFTAEYLSQQRKEKISVVLQDMRLFPEQTVFQNLELKRQLDPYHDMNPIPEMAARLGIGDKLSSLCKNCSYGEQQRVAIIRSLLQPFQYLLLDEPFSHLDNNNAEKAMQLMLEEAEKRKAAIVFADLERVDFFPFTRIFHL